MGAAGIVPVARHPPTAAVYIINSIYILYSSASVQQLEAVLELEIAAVSLAAVFCRFDGVY